MSESDVLDRSSHVLPGAYTGNSRERLVMIECPIAGVHVPTGLRASSMADVADDRHFMTEQCEACGELHHWWRRDAELV